MTTTQRQIRDLIEKLEEQHGIVQAFRVTKHLAEAFNELAKRPLAPKRGKDRVYGSSSVTKTLALVPKQPNQGTQEPQGSIGATNAVSEYPPNEPATSKPEMV